MMKRITNILLFLTTLLLTGQAWTGQARSVESLVDPYTIDSTRYVWDELGYFTLSERDSLDQLCARLNHQADMESAIVIVDEIDQDPFDFTLALYNRWGLGKNDRGILLLVAEKQHKWQFITGYGAEGTFPDGLLAMIGQRKLVPYFRDQDYYGGIREAFIELYNIAADDEYIDKHHYDRSQFASYSSNSSSNSSSSDSSQGESLFDWACTIYGMILAILGICGFVFTDESCGFKTESAIKEKKIGNERYKISIQSDKKLDDVGVWSGHGCLRYFLVDVPFIFVVYFVGKDEYNFLWFVICFLAYIGYKALLYVIVTLIRTNQKEVTDQDRYIVYHLISTSYSTFFYKLFAPYITFPFYWYLRAKVKQLRKELVKCPQCDEELVYEVKDEPNSDDPIFKYETDNRIQNWSYRMCANNHKIIIGMPAANYSKYRYCDNCAARCMKEVSRKSVKKATTSSTGIDRVTYQCEFCQSHKSEVEITAKLSTSGGGGYSRSGGAGWGGGWSGGSRGGGSSGGGGAGGGW